MTNETIAITGASGYLGQALSAQLRAIGQEVRPIGRSPDGSVFDVSDPGRTGPQAFADCSAVVHLAARLVGPEREVSDYFGDNVALTERVMADSCAAGVSQFLYSSTRLVYPGDLGRAMLETDEAPDNPYGLSKLMGEQVTRYWAAKAGGSATTLRLSQVVGPAKGGRGVIGKLADQAISEGRVHLDSTGLAVRDFVHLDDVVAAFVKSILTEDVPPTLNIGSGGVAMSEVVQLVAQHAGLGPDAVSFGAHDDRTAWSLDCSLAAASIQWSPAVSLDTFIADRVLLADRQIG